MYVNKSMYTDFPPKRCVEDWRLGSVFIQNGQGLYCLPPSVCIYIYNNICIYIYVYRETCSLLDSYSYLACTCSVIILGCATNQSIQQLPNRTSQNMSDGCTMLYRTHLHHTSFQGGIKTHHLDAWWHTGRHCCWCWHPFVSTRHMRMGSEGVGIGRLRKRSLSN